VRIRAIQLKHFLCQRGRRSTISPWANESGVIPESYRPNGVLMSAGCAAEHICPGGCGESNLAFFAKDQESIAYLIGLGGSM